MEGFQAMMSTRVVRRMLPPAAALFALLLIAASPALAQVYEGSFDRTLTVTGPVNLTVLSGSGSIRVQPGAAGAVHIVARLKADGSWTSTDASVEQRIRQIEKNPPIDQQGGTIVVGRFADSEIARNISISYDVTLPADASVTAKSGSGSVEIGAVKGAVEASTGSGSIQASGAARLTASTGSGSIRAAAIAGPVTAKTGSGSITVSQSGPGDVSASSGSGGITLSGVNGAARVNTGSGSVSVDGRPVAPWSLHAASGSVQVTVPPDAAFSLDAHSSSGAITSAHEVTMTVTGAVDKHHVAGKVRGGGPTVEISTASGAIRIK